MTRQAYIAAKAPRLGQVKTRLARDLGDAAALELYRAFLVDLAAEFPDIGWFVTPPDAWSEIAHTIAPAGPAPTRWLDQGPGDWTQRQRFLFATAAARGEDRTVLIGSDSPQLRAEVIAQAFAALDDHEVVLGPTFDGGYYLIGMRGWHDVLAGVAMSTHDVFGEIMDAAGRDGLRVAILEATFDVDEVEDLTLLRRAVAHGQGLQATRAALARVDAAVIA